MRRQPRSAGAAACAEAPAGHGRAQRHAGFLLRWRPVPRAGDRDRACRAQMVAEGADILDIGAEFDPPLRRHAAGRRSRTRWRGSKPVLPAVVDARRSGLDRHHQGEGRRLGARRRRRHRQRRLGPAARSRHGARGRRARRAGRHHAQPRQRRSRDRHRGRHDGVLRAARSTSRRAPASRASEIVLDPGIGFGKTPEQSMHVIARLDALQDLRPAAAGRRLAQALHRHRRRPAEPDQRLRRLARRASAGGARTARRSCAPTTWPRPCRRCASPPPSGARR